MAICEGTREAVEEMMLFYIKSGWPNLWMGYSRLPEEAQAVTGFEYGYVMGDRRSITIVDAPCLVGPSFLAEGQTISYMPSANPGYPQTVAPQFHHPFKPVVAAEAPIAILSFTAKAGAEFTRAACNRVSGIRHPIVLLELTRWKAPKAQGGDWQYGVQPRPKELKDLVQALELNPPGKSNALTLGVMGERAGHLMKGIEGRLELYGSSLPFIIRSNDDAVVSIVMAPSAADIEAAVIKRDEPGSKEQISGEQTLTGFEEAKKDAEKSEASNDGMAQEPVGA